MKSRQTLFLLTLATLLLAGCRGAPATPVPAIAAADTQENPTRAETMVAAGQEQRPASTAAPGANRTPSPTASNPVPAPTLFELAWDDPAPYDVGLTAAAAARALPSLSWRPVYHLDVSLGADLRTASGIQEVRFVNNEDQALDELFFHLFPNLLGGRVTVREVSVNGRPATPRLLNDNSILAVPLAEALPPGEAAVVGLTFRVQVPTEGNRNYGVFVVADEVLALAHFYPQLAVYDDEGWQIDLPPTNADPTYADAAFYLVRVEAAEEQVLAASGVVLERAGGDGRQQLTVAIGPARDFYLASSRRYEQISRQVGPTTVNVYGFREAAASMTAVLDYAAESLAIVSRLIAPYPYTELDVAPTVNLALGVEYPGTVAINSRLYNAEEQFGGLPSAVYLESTVAHEVVHQWFYNVVGNDQLDEPWLDEALTQYGTLLYFQERYGPGAAAGFRQSWIERWERVDGAEIPIGLPASSYEGTEYGAIVYGRGPLFFESLAKEMGQTAFARFLQDYYRQNEWGIASGQGLQRLAERHCNCRLEGLFADWVGQP